MTFLCMVCRRPREKYCHYEKLECCGQEVQLCEEVCKESIPRVCNGMTPTRYGEFYAEVHALVCQERKRKDKLTQLKVIQGPWEGSTPEPDQASTQLPEPDPNYINSVFGNGGYLSKDIPNYQERPSQILLARSIDEAIRNKQHVIAEGPTGTGKSLAYSVPAAYHAVHSNRRFCIVTSNKTLQQQIYAKDLLALKKAVPWDFTYAIRKGVNSYLCERDLKKGRYRRLLYELQGKEEKTEEDVEMEAMIYSTVEWAEGTLDGDSETITGIAPNKKVWSYFSTSRDACDGKHCSELKNCHAAKARAAAEDVQIVVTNYWMFYLHIRNSTKEQPSMILPDFDVAILDEAHNAPDIARGFWGVELSKWTIRQAIAGLRASEFGAHARAGEELWDKCWSETDELWERITKRYKDRHIRVTGPSEIPSMRLENLLEQAVRLYKKVAVSWLPEQDRRDAEAAQMRAQANLMFKRSDRCADAASKLEIFRTVPMLDADRWKRQVYYLEQDGGDVKLMSKSLFVGAHLRHQLFDVYPTVVQTSATLAISGRTRSPFNHLKQEMGMLGMDNIELTVDSPFRWKEQCLLVIPDERTIPSYSEDFDGWEKGLGPAVEKIVRIMKGRTMVLFTSIARMNAAKDHLEAANLPFNIYTQGSLSPAELQRKFVAEENSVLLGCKRFSEGIDVQGQACTCVIIDKLPFGQPGDPLIEAIGDLRAQEEGVTKKEGGMLAFKEHSVPEAIISFKQRMGRLIRTVKDSGIVVVLDDRLRTKNYGKQFMKSIPDVQVSGDIEDIAPFLKNLGLL